MRRALGLAFIFSTTVRTSRDAICWPRKSGCTYTPCRSHMPSSISRSDHADDAIANARKLQNVRRAAAERLLESLSPLLPGLSRLLFKGARKRVRLSLPRVEAQFDDCRHIGHCERPYLHISCLDGFHSGHGETRTPNPYGTRF